MKDNTVVHSDWCSLNWFYTAMYVVVVSELPVSECYVCSRCFRAASE